MKSSILIALGIGFAGFGALEVAALNPDEIPAQSDADAKPATDAATTDTASSEYAELMSNPVQFDDNADDSCLTPALVAAFEPRHRELQQRASALDLREAELKDLEQTIETRLEEMKGARDELQRMTQTLNAVANEDISHLVEMYSTMKAKKAASIFDRMDPAFAAGFLREIDSARAGMIMAEMGEEQSYRVSLLIANRHAEWRDKG